MARDGLLPAALARVSSRGTPVRITIFTAIVVVGHSPASSRWPTIAALANAGTLAAFVAVCAAMLVLRRARARPRAQVHARRCRGWSASSASSAASTCSSACPDARRSSSSSAQIDRPRCSTLIYGSAPPRRRAPRANALTRESARFATSLAVRRATSSNGSTGMSIPPSTLYFAPAFFPEGRPDRAIAERRAIFAVGFVMRPIGAWVMGIYADRKGRKAGLTLSVGLMCRRIADDRGGSDLCAGGTAGAGDPAGRADAAGASASAANMGRARPICRKWRVSERRGFWASFQYVTLIGGQLLALAVVLVLQA